MSSVTLSTQAALPSTKQESPEQARPLIDAKISKIVLHALAALFVGGTLAIGFFISLALASAPLLLLCGLGTAVCCDQLFKRMTSTQK